MSKLIHYLPTNPTRSEATRLNQPPTPFLSAWLRQASQLVVLSTGIGLFYGTFAFPSPAELNGGIQAILAILAFFGILPTLVGCYLYTAEFFRWLGFGSNDG